MEEYVNLMEVHLLVLVLIILMEQIVKSNQVDNAYYD
jgi:hypothetical protein